MAPANTTHTAWETIAEAAKRTRYSEDTFRELISSGRLPAYRLSSRPKARIRLKVADVDALLEPMIPTEIYGGAR